MPASPEHDPKKSRTRRDRHGRRTRSTTTGTTRTGPRHTLGPPKTIPMTEQQYQQAVRLWTVLIAQWLTDHPPEP
ncbi:hypothetical protein ACQPZX_08350 [Actinoplanes sp. CA-142083]|uniref:hypothetical protein n=1 Tax=Actinoplanes sp. CA-142083 TaxID=3239903 RepID=UPI003D8F41FB